MTHDDHDQTLAAIEQRLLACDTPLDDIDARIAEVLGVPLDYYFAYRLVAGAIDSHRTTRPDQPPTSPEEAQAALHRAEAIADSMAVLTAAMYRATTGSGSPGEAAIHAARLSGLRLELSEQLRRATARHWTWQLPLPFTATPNGG